MSELATIQNEAIVNHEVYGRSLYGLRQLGKVAVEGSLETMDSDKSSVQERAWNDFYTGTEENLTTDPEFGEKLVFDPMNTWRIQNNQVVSEDGMSMTELVKNGWKASRKAAESDTRMKTQATRDEGDVMVASWVDNLEPGEMLAVVSMDPKEAIKQDREFWEETMAYREGMAVIQTYYREEDQVITGTYSVKRSDKQAMAHALQERGVAIDATLDDSLWTRYPVRQHTTREDAMQFGRDLRTRHRELIGDTTEEYSVSEFMKRNNAVISEYFKQYMIPLAEATHTNKNNQTMQSLAQAILENSGNLQTSLRESVIRIANSSAFSDDDARTMEGMIRYALVEELRTKLPAFMKSEKYEINEKKLVYTDSFIPTAVTTAMQAQILDQQMFHNRLATNIGTGAQANRSYGGCAPGSVSTDQANPDVAAVPTNQDVFGGVSNETESSGEEDEDCEFISKECPKCGEKNVKTQCVKGTYYGACGCVSD